MNTFVSRILQAFNLSRYFFERKILPKPPRRDLYAGSMDVSMTVAAVIDRRYSHSPHHRPRLQQTLAKIRLFVQAHPRLGVRLSDE